MAHGPAHVSRPSGHGAEPSRGDPVHRSIWPAALAAGFALLLFGLVTSLAFSAAGGLMMLGALGGWIGELRHA
jgi:hypothetical protein